MKRDFNRLQYLTKKNSSNLLIPAEMMLDNKTEDYLTPSEFSE